VAQNITSASYKGVGEWVDRWGGVDGVDSGLRLSFRHNGTSCCAKGAVNGLSKPHYKPKQAVRSPITVMDNWEQFHTNATLLKPTKHCLSLIRTLQGHEKLSGKADLAIYSYSVVVSG